MKRFLNRLLKLILTSGLLAGMVYVGTDSFSDSWRSFVIKELAARGLHLDFAKLLLNPIGGIAASQVKVYADASHKLVLAEIDHLDIDCNMGKLMEKKFVL